MADPIAREFDVVVIGGGPAGTSVSSALAQRGVSILIVERSHYEKFRFGETFPPEIQPTLAEMGLWQDFQAGDHLRSAGIRSVWGNDEPYDQSFMFNPYNEGWHVDRRAFDLFLATHAKERGVELALDATLVKCERNSSGDWDLLVRSGKQTFTVRAKFLVDAAGRACVLARNFHRRRVIYDRLVGIYGLFKSVHHNGPSLTLIEATKDGWWYSAPLPRECHVVAFMTDSDLCASLLMGRASHWKTQLDSAPHTRAAVASLEFDGSLNVLPANTSHLNESCGERWMAIGDAASSLDPLSGNGVLRALRSGLAAGQTILSVLSGDESALREHQSVQQQEFRLYLEQRRAYYRRENRWSKEPFWSRRHEPVAGFFEAGVALPPSIGLP